MNTQDDTISAKELTTPEPTPITRAELIDKMVEHRGDDWDHHDTDEVLRDGRIGFNEMTNGELEDLAFEWYMMEEDGEVVKYHITDADPSKPSAEAINKELLEALRASLLAIPDGMTSNSSPIVQQIRAAIAKAEGR